MVCPFRKLDTNSNFLPCRLWNWKAVVNKSFSGCFGLMAIQFLEASVLKESKSLQIVAVCAAIGGSQVPI